MLFNARINEIETQINHNATEIDALLLRVEALRAENLALESHLQQLGSAESAAESAIEQIKTALMMIDSISPAEVNTFKDAIDNLFGTEIPLLLPVSEDMDSPIPDDNGPDSGEFPTPILDDNDPDDEESPTVDDLFDKTTMEIIKALEGLSINQLRKLSKRRCLLATGSASELRRRLLADGISVGDVNVFRSSLN